MAIPLSVNATVHAIELDGRTPLLWVLRDTLGLTGTKYGCGISQCGACTVFLDEVPARACQIALESVGRRKVTTIEAVAGPEAETVQAAWIAHAVPQCGYCQSGQVMSAIALLKRNRRPDDAAIEAAMNGNICRCGTYLRIRAAIKDAARKLQNAEKK